MTKLIEYPEHEKLKKIQDKSQAIGEFFEWLQGKYTIATYYPVKHKLDNHGNFEIIEDKTADHALHAPVFVNIRDLLAEYFNIDQDKLEQEKRQAIAELSR